MSNWLRECKMREHGDITIIGGDMNAPIMHANAPHLIGTWASHREGSNSESLINLIHASTMSVAEQIHVVNPDL